MKIFEGLEYEDMKGMISDEIHIDRYKPKIGTEDETVVVALVVTYEDPAKDLSNFIETGDFEHLDVEASEVPDTDGSYMVFVEFQRDHELFEKIEAMLTDINQITNKKDKVWKYIAYKSDNKSREFNKENFRRDIVDSASEYRRKFTDSINESLLRLKKLIEY